MSDKTGQHSPSFGNDGRRDLDIDIPNRLNDSDLLNNSNKEYPSYSENDVFVDHSYINKDIKDTTLKFGSLNVCGVKSKFISSDFENFVRSRDIICFCETKLSDIDRFELAGFKIFTKNRKGVKRASVGVAVCVRDNLSKYVKILDTDSDFTLWFKIDRRLTGYIKDLLCCVVYLPPEGSNYSSIEMFDTIEEEFILLHDNEMVCMFGDYNSRTRTLTDLVGLDPVLLE